MYGEGRIPILFIYSVYKMNIFCYILYMIKEHPTLLGVLVDSEGLIFIPASLHHKARWTIGTDCGNGYHKIHYHKKPYYVHRLVAETFIPNPENKPCVDHIDRNPANNHVDNLRWVTYSENNYNSNRNLPEDQQLKNFKSKREYANYRYKNDIEFRDKCKNAANNLYRNNTEYREKMLDYKRKKYHSMYDA